MSFNTFGKIFRFTTWGESHGPAIGCVVDGCPPNIPINADDIQIEYTKGATYEELAMKARIVRWLKLIVPEWRVVYGLWQRAAWKRVSKKAVTITRISRVLSATGSGSAFGVKPGVKSTKILDYHRTLCILNKQDAFTMRRPNYPHILHV